ncbi:MAG: efflux RND transporter periplasmic adaptor subunit [Synechococcus sp. SB0668_bin_15]|nr:efflux RND transporter periplasmic adaptor subunit [Synechococcus sp. SB0668_bin_15]MXZ83271.1 efflux RND transporter periplasmic adaptor subunit [Synechococcus sp. SB0666_bin_14]MYA91549.1 efflux RND transporter periplasmic adaptor subunit [Synechococcus sp. SB0663_bin_10]MYC48698.1 efflux RND transporter periplasmic adaptor subunit [Synechococcus sp. SB0662_bin_14]MYG46739.1 efflux RND transporter periplasmic adaptor subunit [Synechococcus sp. SB0675_bin_6]MYJ59068.1 efflux RND transporte
MTAPLASTTDLRQPAWLRWAGRLGLVAALVAAGAWGMMTFRRPSVRDLDPYTVVVEQQALRGTVVATGTVEPVRQVSLSPPQPGIVAAINVEEGEQVRAGQVLVVMDGGDLPIRIKERQALLTQAEEELGLREEELIRQQKLVEAGALSQLALSQLESRYRAQQSQVVANWQRLQELLQEQRELTVQAPFDGLVMERFAEPRSYVTPSGSGAANTSGATKTSLLTLGTGHQVVAVLPDNEIGRLQLNQDARVLLDAFPNQPLDAQVDIIAPRSQVNDNVITFDVTLKLLAENSRLRYGMSGDVQFFTEELSPSPVVPTVAVATRSGQSGVYVVGRDDQPTFRPVALGYFGGSNIQVLDGLAPGERVFIDWPAWARQPRGRN